MQKIKRLPGVLCEDGEWSHPHPGWTVLAAFVAGAAPIITKVVLMKLFPEIVEDKKEEE